MACVDQGTQRQASPYNVTLCGTHSLVCSWSVFFFPARPRLSRGTLQPQTWTLWTRWTRRRCHDVATTTANLPRIAAVALPTVVPAAATAIADTLRPATRALPTVVTVAGTIAASRLKTATRVRLTVGTARAESRLLVSLEGERGTLFTDDREHLASRHEFRWCDVCPLRHVSQVPQAGTDQRCFCKRAL